MNMDNEYLCKILNIHGLVFLIFLANNATTKNMKIEYDMSTEFS